MWSGNKTRLETLGLMFLCTVLIVTSLASYPGWAQDQGKRAGTLHAGVSLSDPMQPAADITQIRSDPMQPAAHITQIRSDLVQTPARITQIRSDPIQPPTHITQIRSDSMQTPARITQIRSDPMQPSPWPTHSDQK